LGLYFITLSDLLFDYILIPNIRNNEWIIASHIGDAEKLGLLVWNITEYGYIPYFNVFPFLEVYIVHEG
jgi:hypothetical protein